MLFCWYCLFSAFSFLFVNHFENFVLEQRIFLCKIIFLYFTLVYGYKEINYTHQLMPLARDIFLRQYSAQFLLHHNQSQIQ